MTENEEKRPKVAIVGGGRGAGRILKAHIELLEELEAYRAIGTVEEIQSKLEAYRELGTMEELKALKEKNEPKKPIILDRRFENGDEVCVEWKCPVCGLNVIEEPPCQEHCQRCGNKIDWN